MGLKLSLTAKGLILVSIPVLFEVGFVWALVNLDLESEAEAQQAIKTRDISQRVSALLNKVYDIWRIFDQGKQQHTSELGSGDIQLASKVFAVYKSMYLPRLESMKRDYAALEELTKDRPDFNLNVKKAEKSLDEANSILDEAFGVAKNGRMDLVAGRYRSMIDRVVSLFQDLATQNMALEAKAERDAAELGSQRHASVRQLMISLLLLVCAFNALFCVLLAWFLVKSIISRVGVMSDNAQRLAASQSLNLPVSGDDEIAELDKVFHSMADDIQETARMRQELVSMLTHDLRSPLTAIQGSLELLDLQAEQKRDEREKRLVEVAQRNSSRMMRLINDLLDIHKIKEGMMSVVPTEVCLAEVFEEVALSVAAWIEDNAIKLKIDDTDLFVYAEREKVERVIFNLVANAIKFSPAGGTIGLSVSADGRMVKISVSDQGQGIPADQKESIFERFQQVESSDEKQSAGSGLGLTICQYLVRLHGGEIWVTSEIGRGSVFCFTLPLA